LFEKNALFEPAVGIGLFTPHVFQLTGMNMHGLTKRYENFFIPGSEKLIE